MLGAAILIADINDTKSGLSSLSLSKTVPIGNSDAGSYFNNQVLSAVDYGVRCTFLVCLGRVVTHHWTDVKCARLVCKHYRRGGCGLGDDVFRSDKCPTCITFAQQGWRPLLCGYIHR